MEIHNPAARRLPESLLYLVRYERERRQQPVRAEERASIYNAQANLTKKTTVYSAMTAIEDDNIAMIFAPPEAIKLRSPCFSLDNSFQGKNVVGGIISTPSSPVFLVLSKSVIVYYCGSSPET